MDNISHTRGPWRWLTQGRLTLTAGKNGKHLLEAVEAPGLGHEAQANRDIIAAAPEMLDALVDLYETWLCNREHYEDEIERYEPLIFKARGEKYV